MKETSKAKKWLILLLIHQQEKKENGFGVDVECIYAY